MYNIRETKAMKMRWLPEKYKGGSRYLCYKCGELGCSYCREHRALVLNSQRYKHFGSLQETVVGQRIRLFPVWLTAVRIDRRQDLDFFCKGKDPHL